MIVFTKYCMFAILLSLLLGEWSYAFTNDMFRTVSSGGSVQSVDIDGEWICGQGIGGMSQVATAGTPVSSEGGRDVSAAACSFFVGGLNQVVWNENDADGDGIIDENDLDDDNDGLSDANELSGGAFSPVTGTDSLVADSDGDGADDYAEMIAGTNPRDATHCFELQMYDPDSLTEPLELRWRSRYGRTYRILRADTIEELVVAPQEFVVMQGTVGSDNPPWYDGISSWDVVDSNPRSLYRVIVDEP
jgi:hypothetical protein